MIEHLLDSVKIEIVADVLFVNFAEKVVVLQVAEPVYPADALLWTVGLWLRHSLCVWSLNFCVYINCLFIRGIENICQWVIKCVIVEVHIIRIYIISDYSNVHIFNIDLNYFRWSCRSWVKIKKLALYVMLNRKICWFCHVVITCV